MIIYTKWGNIPKNKQIQLKKYQLHGNLQLTFE